MPESPTSPGPAIIVADSHREAGLGHLSRSTAIAVALRCRGIEVACFAIGSAEPMERDGVSWVPFDPSTLPDGRVLVADSYRLAPHELVELAGLMPLVLLHDFGEPPPDAAMIVSPADEDSESSSGRLTGLGYVTLRPMFWGLPQRELRQTVERVLVTTGGGSLEPVAYDLAVGLRDALPNATVALVRVPYGRRDAPAGVELVDSPDSLLNLLLGVDVAVTAGGQTMLEAAAAGTPCVAVPLADNQARQAQRLSAVGAVRLCRVEQAPTVVVELVAKAPERAALSRSAQRAIDGYGALRVAFEIARLIERQP